MGFVRQWGGSTGIYGKVGSKVRFAKGSRGRVERGKGERGGGWVSSNKVYGGRTRRGRATRLHAMIVGDWKLGK